MELKDLRTFLAVARDLHFGRASERLHMAQPAVSRLIKALERELGADLFNRSTRSVSLTPAGEALIGPAERIFAEVERAKEDVAAAGRGAAGRVRIAFAGASSHVLVGRLARASRSRFPGLMLELLSQNFAQPALSRVLAGEVDIGIGRWDDIPAGIETRVLVDEQLMLAVPDSHPRAGARSVSISAFEGEPFVALPAHPGSVLTDRLLRLCHSAGFEPRVVQEAPDSWTALALVSAEVGALLTISTVAENTNHHGVSFIPVSDEIQRVQLRMAWRADSENPGLSKVLGVAEEVLLEQSHRA